MEKNHYIASIDGMKLRLEKLQSKNNQAWKFRVKHSKNWDNVKKFLYYYSLLYVLEIIQIKLICKHHNDLLAGYFGIKTKQEFIAQKYCWLTIYHDIKDFVKRCNVYLTLNIIWYKPYDNLQFLSVFNYYK